MRQRRFHSRAGRGCLVCQHKDRVRIEALKCAGASLDSIAKKFDVSRDSVWRHMANHVDDDQRSRYLADVPVAELAQLAASEGTSVLEYLSLVRSILMSELQLASQVHSHSATAALAGRLNEILRTIGSLSGELGDMATRSLTINGNVITNVMNHPQIANLQANLLRALAPFPAARAAVIGALRAMDAPVDELASAPDGSQKLLELQAVSHVG
jgi:hypothetical protein